MEEGGFSFHSILLEEVECTIQLHNFHRSDPHSRHSSASRAVGNMSLPSAAVIWLLVFIPLASATQTWWDIIQKISVYSAAPKSSKEARNV